MADILEATEDRIVRKVAGTDRTFLILSGYDRAEMLRGDLANRKRRHEERRTKIVDSLKLAGLTGEMVYRELLAFDDTEPFDATEKDWENFVSDPLNDPPIFAISLRKTYGNEADELAKLVSLPLADKAKICGLVVRYVSAQDNPSPNPAAPAVYQTPAEPTNSAGASPPASYSTGSESPTP